LVYVYRRRVVDSGGPGKFRGGLSHEFAFTASARHLKDDQLNVTLFGKGVRAPMSLGLFGGYPGCPIAYGTFRALGQAQIQQHPPAHDARAAERPSWGTHILRSQDLQVIRYNGGGGYGDPLDRDPDAVLRDVAIGAVSEGAAQSVYGIVFERESTDVDAASTADLRRTMRAARIGKHREQVPVERTAVPAGGARISEYLQADTSGAIGCAWCGGEIANAGNQWKDGAVRRLSPISQSYAHAVNDATLALDEYFCPGCGTLLECTVSAVGDPPIHDEIALERSPGRAVGE
jgi:N-methylhydantoinase B